MIYMELQQGIFAVKLCELEKEYGLLQSTIGACQGQDPQNVRRMLHQVQEAFQTQNRLLALSARSCSLPCVSALAASQADSWKQAEELFHTRFSQDMEDPFEASALYAEYAIDSATQAMRYALICALSAMDLQNQTTLKEESHK